jgi:hypothetical protein
MEKFLSNTHLPKELELSLGMVRSHALSGLAVQKYCLSQIQAQKRSRVMQTQFAKGQKFQEEEESLRDYAGEMGTKT